MAVEQRGGEGRAASKGLRAVLLLAALTVMSAGCETPIAQGVDDAEANRILVALDKSQVGAQKESDPSSEGKFRIVVGREDVARAAATLRDEDLPRPARPSGIEGLAKGQLVVSREVEHQTVVSAQATELEKTLERVEGILAARVHLSMPLPDPLKVVSPKSSASVLVEHRGATPPLSPEAIQRLVAGATSGLAREDVSVVTVERPRPAIGSSTLARVGPITVAHGSMRLLQGAIAALIGAIVFLGTSTLVLYQRMLRLRAALPAGNDAS